MLKSIVDVYATLILAPAILLGVGGSWTWLRSFDLTNASTVGPADAEGRRDYTYTHLAFVEENAAPSEGTPLGGGAALEIRLPRPVTTFAVTLQADAHQSYRIESSRDGSAWHDFWVAPGSVLSDEGLVSRTSPLLAQPEPVGLLRIRPEAGSRQPVVAGVRLDERVLALPYPALLPLVWATWLGLALLTRSRHTRERALQAQRIWCRADVLIAGTLVAVALFDPSTRPVATALWSAGLVAILALVKAAARRVSPQTALATTLSLAVALFVAPRLWAQLTLARIAEIHDLSVDHRNRPDGVEINADGARFRGEAGDLRDEDFVVLFLGDSFTYGLGLDYEEAYPAAVERTLRANGCPEHLRVVNFGWSSSSPLLGLRMLRDVGHRYRPDLVVYNLDMTDFQDDLRYEEELRAADGRAFGAGEVLWAALVARAPALERWGTHLAALAPLRSRGVDASAAVPRDRFFATSRPLAASRALIERGVVRNLGEIQRYAARELDAPLVVFVLPRAYQHSRTESPRSWERARYEILGPFALEPFRYFEETGGQLGYPTISLLPAFRQAEESPLYFEDDPHWNATGAHVAAEAAATHLLETGLLPCTGTSPKR